MVGIALDLGGPPGVAFDHHARGDTTQQESCGIIQGLAGDDLFRLLDVRYDLIQRGARAGRQPRQRHGCAHQPQEIAATDAIFPFRSAIGEFTVQEFLKRFGVGYFVEATPICFALPVSQAFANGCQIELFVIHVHLLNRL